MQPVILFRVFCIVATLPRKGLSTHYLVLYFLVLILLIHKRKNCYLKMSLLHRNFDMKYIMISIWILPFLILKLFKLHIFV